MSRASSDTSRRVMRSNMRRDTAPELAVRRILHAKGMRYRVDFRVVRETRSRADIAFTRQRIAVFIDGCFWHSCPEHLHLPKANADYWIPKLARNVERDAEVAAVLRGLGWTVLRFWEHVPAQDTADRIIVAVERARESASRAGHPRHADVDGSQ
ncbi:very short patch repair endonuclease [Clavibacter michiganensis]|uniref:Patch repair endonuclease n=2 Tax=Clavibacter michiganensis TaxID=28447 RepID=A5CSG2_CLAM3|nr:very short patch repair endonuclease [Clavibacter michiganensis]MWJ33985.1 very short patch repair endonuclease [Clavibacter michiganensis subsp. michiganensis]MWJ41812.1 very short patch repair endonuclease [Clavibacter michiganensis subsp. michiganensis]CAN02026.1 putative patch repair endonuclease [Clavibacter michiganensis subsp. michiganensis NCPPB 382]